jgi:hypothetical protein
MAVLRATLDQPISQREELEALRAQRAIKDEPDRVSNEATFLRISDKVISIGETLYSRSVASRSVRPELMLEKSTFVYEGIKDADAIDRWAAPMSRSRLAAGIVGIGTSSR